MLRLFELSLIVVITVKMPQGKPLGIETVYYYDENYVIITHLLSSTNRNRRRRRLGTFSSPHRHGVSAAVSLRWGRADRVKQDILFAECQLVDNYGTTSNMHDKYFNNSNPSNGPELQSLNGDRLFKPKHQLL